MTEKLVTKDEAAGMTQISCTKRQFRQHCHMLQASEMWDWLNCSVVGMEVIEKPSVRSDLKKSFLNKFWDHFNSKTRSLYDSHLYLKCLI